MLIKNVISEGYHPASRMITVAVVDKNVKNNTELYISSNFIEAYLLRCILFAYKVGRSFKYITLLFALGS